MTRIAGGIGALCLGMSVLGGCQDDALTPSATVMFIFDAPLCSSSVPVEFLIDSVVAGRDTFRINLPPDDTISPAFRTSAGTHLLGARVVNGLVWPDTTVTIAAGESVTRRLPFYCS